MNRQPYCNYDKSNTALLVSWGLTALISLGNQDQLGAGLEQQPTVHLINGQVIIIYYIP